MDKGIIEYLNVIAVNMVGKELTEHQIMFWDEFIHPYDPSEVMAALKQHCRQSKFMPKPSEIIEIIDGSLDERIQIAYETARTAARLVGGYASWSCGDKILMTALNKYGWRKFASDENTDERWFAFKRVYVSAKRSRTHDTCVVGYYQESGNNYSRYLIHDDKIIAVEEKLGTLYPIERISAGPEKAIADKTNLIVGRIDL